MLLCNVQCNNTFLAIGLINIPCNAQATHTFQRYWRVTPLFKCWLTCYGAVRLTDNGMFLIAGDTRACSFSQRRLSPPHAPPSRRERVEVTASASRAGSRQSATTHWPGRYQTPGRHTSTYVYYIHTSYRYQSGLSTSKLRFYWLPNAGFHMQGAADFDQRRKTIKCHW